MTEPAGKQFPDFLVREVMPLVNDKYRAALTGAPNTGIGGSSFGGGGPRCMRYWPGRVSSGTGWDRESNLVGGDGPAGPGYEPSRGHAGQGVHRASAARGGRRSRDGSRKMIGMVQGRAGSQFPRARGYDGLERARRHRSRCPAHRSRLGEASARGTCALLFGDWKPRRHRRTRTNRSVRCRAGTAKITAPTSAWKRVFASLLSIRPYFAGRRRHRHQPVRDGPDVR